MEEPSQNGMINESTHNGPEKIAEQIPSCSTKFDYPGYPGFLEAIRQAKRKKKSHDVSFEILFSYLPESVIKHHDFNLNEWWNYCLVENKDPLETDLSVVIGYLGKKLDAGTSPEDLKSISSTVCLIASDKMERQIYSSSFLFSEFAKYSFVNNTDGYKTPKLSYQNNSDKTKNQDESKISSVQIENVKKAKSSEMINISDDHPGNQSPSTSLKKPTNVLNNNVPTIYKKNSVMLQKGMDNSQVITTPSMKSPTTTTKPPAILLHPASKNKVSENKEIKELTRGSINSQQTILKQEQDENIQQQQSTLSPANNNQENNVFTNNVAPLTTPEDLSDEIGSTNNIESYTYLRKSIDNPKTAIVQDQVEGNSVKILATMKNGELLLITFDIPNEKITFNDLLEQAGVPFNGTTTVSLVKDPVLKINYIVESETGKIVNLTETSDVNNELSIDGSVFSDKQCLQDDDDDDNDWLNLDKKNFGTNLKVQSALLCQMVIIGSYRYIPKGHIIINTTGLTLSVPLLGDKTETKVHVLKVHVEYQDIVKVSIHSGRPVPVLFFYTISSSKIRNLLGMNNPNYDSAGKDQTYQRIVLFPKLLSSSSIMVLKKLFPSDSFIKELNAKQAHDILTRGASLRDFFNISKITNDDVENSTIHPAAPTKDDDTNKSITISQCAKLSCINKDTHGNDELTNNDSRQKTSSVIIEKTKLDKSQPAQKNNEFDKIIATNNNIKIITNSDDNSQGSIKNKINNKRKRSQLEVSTHTIYSTSKRENSLSHDKNNTTDSDYNCDNSIENETNSNKRKRLQLEVTAEEENSNNVLPSMPWID
ncbi:hypothetical protein HCN44_007102 [Aphidius gifuensis]|uniref:Uncharacterized protein n=1 Tax=Aphidius gifuensis TaxID=684658 RepID=A0A834XNJ3_APHGI|nr:hypothetical protein HCN44_007102 [Aphidius gifuensis]